MPKVIIVEKPLNHRKNDFTHMGFTSYPLSSTHPDSFQRQKEREGDEEETIIRWKVRKRQETGIGYDVWCHLNKADRYERNSESQIREIERCKIRSTV